MLKRSAPYIYATWLARHVVGEAQCGWALWFKAHHTYERVPSDFDLTAWSIEHTAMVRRRAEALRSEGWEVTVEDQNHFAVQGRTAVVAGKPDIIARQGDTVLVVDCKTGNEKRSDAAQVLTYMWLLPRDRELLKDCDIAGEVCYGSGQTLLANGDLETHLISFIRESIHLASGADPPVRVPSFAECRRCDISKADCPDRLDTERGPPSRAEDLF